MVRAPRRELTSHARRMLVVTAMLIVGGTIA